MRIGSNHSCSSATETRRRVVSPQTDSGFAGALASAVESGDGESGGGTGRKPELSAATYRLFAAVAIERGDTVHADHFRARAADAREAGIPLHPSGVLSDTGRWDYTEDAAAIPETGHFDTATGQGVRTFIPYNTTRDRNAEAPSGAEAPHDCPPAAARSTGLASSGLRGAQTTRATAHPELDALLATLAS
ncbi:MAG: hypothetical protein IT293_09250 [Deltaproteobacteria bacterium]|nr:hypothetical protein [Deltaproteobacteria bacterium]